MPIDNFASKQRQGRLFDEHLSLVLNPQNKIYLLRKEINWTELEKNISTIVTIKNLGRARKSFRILLGVTMLQAMYNLSDEKSSEEFEENMYWQYFCGYEYIEKESSISDATIRRFRNLLGEDGLNIILQELIRVGGLVGSYKKKDLSTVIIDTTVQNKNIKHPHDAYLLDKARLYLVSLCNDLGIKLKETYQKRYKKLIIKLWKYKESSKSPQRKKILKHLKTLLGRLIRKFQKASLNIDLGEKSLEIFRKVQDVFNQSCLGREGLKKYKENNKYIYSLHAPEVECIGKGKLRKPFEFGNKVSVCVSGKGNFILGVKSFHGNPYDGHTLKSSVDLVEGNTKVKLEQIFVDRGYKGHDVKSKKKVYTPYSKRKMNSFEKKMQKRRSAIEPIIGHLKFFSRMGRNYLRGVKGDIINPIISAIGVNLRNIANVLIRKLI